MSEFAICLTCPEVTTGRNDSSKGWLLDASSNHFNCKVVPFDDLPNLPAPIRAAILRLGAGLPISNNHVVMLDLGLHMEDKWTPFPSTAPAVAPVSPKSPAPALASAASTRSPRASTPTSATNANAEPSLFDLLDEVTA